MADVFTFGAVNLLDPTKYKTMIPGGSSFRKDPIIDEEYTKQRDGQMFLKTYIEYGYNISFDLYVVGTGNPASYNGALVGFKAIKDTLGSAIDYAAGVSGTAPVQLTHQRFDQSTAEVLNVIGGRIVEKDRSGLVSRGIYATLTLTCIEP